jgi:hypothetical protein
MNARTDTGASLDGRREVERVARIAAGALDAHSGVFTLAIRLGNDAMTTRHDIARAMRELATALSNELADVDSGSILDDNGNTTGRFALVPEPFTNGASS